MRACPKCGGEKGPLLWVERKRIERRVYLYAIHPSSENRSGYMSCYLGPKDSYEYTRDKQSPRIPRETHRTYRRQS